jgi:hypothetical protein
LNQVQILWVNRPFQDKVVKKANIHDRAWADADREGGSINSECPIQRLDRCRKIGGQLTDYLLVPITGTAKDTIHLTDEGRKSIPTPLP